MQGTKKLQEKEENVEKRERNTKNEKKLINSKKHFFALTFFC